MGASSQFSDRFDAIVIGTGLAGLSAALRAKEAGGNVVVIDKAPETSMGGNSRFSGGALRTPSDTVSAADLVKEAMDMSGGRANPRLAHVLYNDAAEALEWLRGYGVRILRSDEERPDFKGSKMPWHAKGNGYGLIAALFPISQRTECRCVSKPRRCILTSTKRATWSALWCATEQELARYRGQSYLLPEISKRIPKCARAISERAPTR